ncbi:MAG: glycoside hydrolase family 32 protein [bacterium]|nr:glycoside hydrolase family 32 protein [bacterium]
MKKYEKVFQKQYQDWYRENEAYREQVSRDKNRLQYHLMPETGWLNDPNGLCQFHGWYHIYYQFTPFEPTGELKLWGHYTTRDFVNYRQEEPVLFPDEDFDAHGVYSGSAWVEDDSIHYFYTGNVKYFDRPDYDYIMTGRGSNVVHVSSKDGYHMSKKECLLRNEDYPADMSAHIRDPKLIRWGKYYDMILGARNDKGEGLVLVYRSEDLKHWQYHSRIQTTKPFGYMWECPDLFVLDGQLLLICCPQGVEQKGVDFANVHQCTVMKLSYDATKDLYEVEEKDGEADIHMLDRGCDFYAPQTFLDEKKRRILIGWMGIPDATYTNPTVEAGWQHALTLPRELSFDGERLHQTPLKELEALRREETSYTLSELSKAERSDLVYEAEMTFSFCEQMTLTLRKGVTLHYQNHLLTLDLGEHGSGRGERSVQLTQLENLRIYSDSSSLEIFVNDGVEVFTTRVYGLEGEIRLEGACEGSGKLYSLRGFEIVKAEAKESEMQREN